jgi:putative FmdB family regulatory protein
MPLYSYKCKCGYEGDHVGKVKDVKIKCPKCGHKMMRQFHSSYGINVGPVGNHGHYDETLGEFISTNAQRKRLMQEQGLSEKIGKGWY